MSMVFKKSYSIIFILLIIGLIVGSAIISLFTPFSVPQPFSLLFPFGLVALLVSYVFVFLTKKTDPLVISRIFVLAFLVYFLMPFGGYMFEGTNNGGLLMPLMFPFGWAAIVFSIFLFLYPKPEQINEKLSLSKVVLVSGIIIFALQILFPYKEFLYFLNPNMLQFAIEVESGFFYGLDIIGALFVIMYPLFCLFTSILLHFENK